MSTSLLIKYEKGEIISDSKLIIEFANAYNVKALDILRPHNVVDMKFTSLKKHLRYR